MLGLSQALEKFGGVSDEYQKDCRKCTDGWVRGAFWCLVGSADRDKTAISGVSICYWGDCGSVTPALFWVMPKLADAWQAYQATISPNLSLTRSRDTACRRHFSKSQMKGTRHTWFNSYAHYKDSQHIREPALLQRYTRHCLKFRRMYNRVAKLLYALQIT